MLSLYVTINCLKVSLLLPPCSLSFTMNCLNVSVLLSPCYLFLLQWTVTVTMLSLSLTMNCLKVSPLLSPCYLFLLQWTLLKWVSLLLSFSVVKWSDITIAVSLLVILWVITQVITKARMWLPSLVWFISKTPVSFFRGSSWHWTTIDQNWR